MTLMKEKYGEKLAMVINASFNKENEDWKNIEY